MKSTNLEVFKAGALHECIAQPGTAVALFTISNYSEVTLNHVAASLNVPCLKFRGRTIPTALKPSHATTMTEPVRPKEIGNKL